MRQVGSYFIVAVLAAGTTLALHHGVVWLTSSGTNSEVSVANQEDSGTDSAKEDRSKRTPTDNPKQANENRPPDVVRGRPPLQIERHLPEEQVNVSVYKKVNQSVVNINTRSVQIDDFLLMARPKAGNGSGSVIDKEGHILTNYHVIEGSARIAATLADGSMYEGKVVGTDPNNDLAVIRIKAPPEKLVPITWGDSSKLIVGYRVFALGNPFGLERTLTTGIVSSLNRSLRSENNRLIRGVVQTDAAINPGNSGGPLLNTGGEMVGITTAIIGRAGQNSGVGLAIPSNTAKRVVKDLIRYGHVRRPDSGIFSVYELPQGLLVGKLDPNGPAEKAGLRGPRVVAIQQGPFVMRGLDRSKADLIVGIDEKKVTSFDDFLTYIESQKSGSRVILHVLREGEPMNIPVTLRESQK